MLNADRIHDAVEISLEAASRWPRLMLVLGFDRHPSPASLNDALQARGFCGQAATARAIAMPTIHAGMGR